MFDATERMRMPAPEGRIGHAELQIGDSVVMLADEFPEMHHVGPKRLGGSPVTLTIYVENVDAVVEKATAKAPRFCKRSKTTSMATGPARSRTPGAIVGA